MKDPTSAKLTIPISFRLHDDEGDADLEITAPQPNIMALAVPRWLSNGQKRPRTLRPPLDESVPAKLEFRSQDFETMTFEFSQQLRIGRAPENDITRDEDVNLSRRHCRFLRLSRSIWIEDLGSQNGTWINGVQVKRKQLMPGDHVLVGSLQFEVWF
jgi:hypothetical protein